MNMLSLKVGSGAEGSGSLPGGEGSAPPREVGKSLPRKAAAEGIGAQQQQQQADLPRQSNMGGSGESLSEADLPGKAGLAS
uniref:Uncharacterized protein n=1 Tax=Sphaerodactylus townsendi TaxID=933632 RepID=A0ACB8FRD2_9SAUR